MARIYDNIDIKFTEGLNGIITNVGVKPTIGTYNKNVETHIFNFDKELYEIAHVLSL